MESAVAAAVQHQVSPLCLHQGGTAQARTLESSHHNPETIPFTIKELPWFGYLIYSDM